MARVVMGRAIICPYDLNSYPVMLTVSILPPPLQAMWQQLQQMAIPAHAWPIVEEYFKCFSLPDFNQELWQLVVASLTNNEPTHLPTGQQRHDLIFFYEFTLLLMEAVSALKQQHR